MLRRKAMLDGDSYVVRAIAISLMAGCLIATHLHSKGASVLALVKIVLTH